MDNIVKEFIVETNEILEELERSLIALGEDPSRTYLLQDIFKKVHTVKGSCGFLELVRLETIFHHLESLLEQMQGEGSNIAGRESLVLNAILYAKDIMKGLEKQGQEPKGNDEKLISRLKRNLNEQEENQILGEEKQGRQEGAIFLEKDTSIKDHSLRIDVKILDKIINIVGELVLTRNEFLERVQDDWESPYLPVIKKLDFITSNLQNESLRTRMQPISNIWNKLPGIIRDGCKKQNKKISLKTIGQETEVDRQVLQVIHDPLIHIVRNAIDHGIETPQERQTARKPETGTVTLKAYHEGGHIVLEVEDDGAGINFERVKQKAIQRNLVDLQVAEQLTEKELVKFLFEPGFTTSDEVSTISGRGIGMNIVLTEISKIGGTVDIHSKQNQGTMIRIKIPLTLAILSVLIFSVDGQSFAIPQTSVSELVRVGQNNRHQLGNIQNAKVLHLRDTYLPLVNLSEIFGMNRKYYYTLEDDFFILVVRVGDVSFGIMVGDVHNIQEIAVKPCGSIIEKIGFYSGATILGDGQVILIIDPAGILENSKLAGMSKLLERIEAEQNSKKENSVNDVAAARQETASFLVFRGSDDYPQAVQLSLIARLEEVERDKIQKWDQGFMMEYRGSILPLVLFDEGILRNRSEIQPVIVFSDSRRQLGLMVKAIDDVVEGVLNIQTVGGKREGVLGVAMINKKAVEVTDMQYFLKMAFADWFELERLDISRNRETKILLVDDSQFFRELVKLALEARGFIARSVEGGEQALKFLHTGFQPDLIISDIVMPHLDGFDLARQIRENSNWNGIKLIALTALVNDNARDKAKDLGFDKYLLKYNQEELLEAIKEVVQNEVKI